MSLAPQEVIVPLIGIKDGVRAFRGTAFFVGAPGTLVTAAHCVEGFDSFEVGAQWVEKEGHHEREVQEAVLECVFEEADLARLHVEHCQPKPLTLFGIDRTIPLNSPAVTLEASTTVVEADGGMVLAPATRVGNVTRVLGICRAGNLPRTRPKAAEGTLA